MNITEPTKSIDLSAPIDPQSSYTNDEILSLVIAVNTLKNEVKNLMVSKVVETNQIPEEIVKPAVNSHFKKNHRLGRPPLEGEIRDAITKTKDMKAAADYLGVSPQTLKYYCRLYGNVGPGGSSLWRPKRGSKAWKNLPSPWIDGGTTSAA